MSKHPWWWLLQFDPCPSILDDYYWDFIHVQASLMNIESWSMSKHPWWWLLQFDPCPSILDYVDWDIINHVEASYMMITVIWSMFKHSWWWLLQFNPCPSILDDVDWDFINVQAYLMMMGVWSMYKYPCWWSSGFNPCLKTNYLSSWPIFGHDDNSNFHRDQIFVTMTKNWSRDKNKKTERKALTSNRK